MRTSCIPNPSAVGAVTAGPSDSRQTIRTSSSPSPGRSDDSATRPFIPLYDDDDSDEEEEKEDEEEEEKKEEEDDEEEEEDKEEEEERRRGKEEGKGGGRPIGARE